MTALRVLLLTALVAPALVLGGCCCPKDECSYDKMCDQYKK